MNYDAKAFPLSSEATKCDVTPTVTSQRDPRENIPFIQQHSCHRGKFTSQY